MGLFSKKNEPKVIAPPPVPVITDADLADAERLMDQWDASIGNSNAMWSCLELIGRRGGYKGGEAVLHETMNGHDTAEVLNRPWCWWNEATRAANSRGQDALAGRIFLFTYLFVTQFRPNMNVGNVMDTGLEKPQDGTYKDIAALAVDSLSKLAPNLLIHDTATGKVDVHNALRFAEEVSGVTASRRPTGPSEHSPDVGDDSQWNSL